MLSCLLCIAVGHRHALLLFCFSLLVALLHDHSFLASRLSNFQINKMLSVRGPLWSPIGLKKEHQGQESKPKPKQTMHVHRMKPCDTCVPGMVTVCVWEACFPHAYGECSEVACRACGTFVHSCRCCFDACLALFHKPSFEQICHTFLVRVTPLIPDHLLNIN